MSWRVTSKRDGFQLVKPRRAGSVIVGRASRDFGAQLPLSLFEGGEREAAQAARKPERDARVVAGTIATREIVEGNKVKSIDVAFVPTRHNVKVKNYA